MLNDFEGEQQITGEDPPPCSSVANEGFAPLCGAAATPVAALKSSVANEGFAPLGGAAATPVAALKTPVAPVAYNGQWGAALKIIQKSDSKFIKINGKLMVD